LDRRWSACFALPFVASEGLKTKREGEEKSGLISQWGSTSTLAKSRGGKRLYPWEEQPYHRPQNLRKSQKGMIKKSTPCNERHLCRTRCYKERKKRAVPENSSRGGHSCNSFAPDFWGGEEIEGKGKEWGNGSCDKIGRRASLEGVHRINGGKKDHFEAWRSSCGVDSTVQD